MSECTVQELAQYLADGKAGGGKPPRFALFLGAGASIESGIDGTEAMMERFRKRLRERWQSSGGTGDFEHWLQDPTKWDSSASDYANLFERYEPSRRGRALHIEKLVAKGTPNYGYLFLSQLLAQGYLDTVVTTNFDDLVYEACASWTSVRPRVFSFGEPAGPIRHQPGRPSILKLHGDFLQSRLLKNTAGEMRQPDPNMETRVQDLMRDYDLIVIGYGGNDNSIMSILEAHPTDHETGIYWCVYKDERLSRRAKVLLDRPNWFRVQTNGFESVMGYFLHTVNFVFPDVERTFWKQKADTITTIMESGSPYRQDFLGAAVKGTKAEAERSVDDVREWVQEFLAAFSAHHKGDPKDAINHLCRARKVRPDDPFTLALLGFALTRSGQAEKAIEILRDAPQRYHNVVDVLSALGFAWTETGRVSKALALLRDALNRYPDNVEVLIILSSALMKGGQVADAIGLLRSAQSRYPDDAHVLSALGSALWQAGHEEETMALLRGAGERFPDNPDVLVLLGFTLTRAGRVAEAIDILRHAEQLYPDDADVLSALGFALIQSGQVSDAIATLRHALALQPDNEVVLADLGLALYKEGRKEEAEQVFHRVVEITDDSTPDDLVRSSWRGVALLAVGRLEDALHVFRALIDHRPQSVSHLRDVLIGLRLLAQAGVAGVQECLSLVDDALPE